MTDQTQFIEHPAQTNKALYGKYSSSQTYYYSNVIGQIVKQRRTVSNINFEDVEYISDLEQYLKRYYLQHQYNGKMSTFKEYYFYHQDCPRIFTKQIEEMYSKWQDRKRDLVYKKLKILYNESISSEGDTSRDDSHKSTEGLTHFLLEISDYNPFSKKYYLRQQIKDKQKQTERQQSTNKLAKTINDLSSLNHNLSIMLNDISQLSAISTLQQQQSPRFSSLYHSKKLKVNYSSQNSTYHNSQSNSHLQNTIKFNFKKNKYSSSKQKDSKTKQKQKEKITQQLQYKISVKKDHSHQKSNHIISEAYLQNQPKLSPKFDKNKITSYQFKQTSTKSKSIIQLSSFNPSRKSQILLNLNINKKDTLKLQSDKKTPSRSNRINLQNKAIRTFQSEKKSSLKSQSHKKMPGILPQNQKLGFQSIGKKGSTVMGSSSSTALKGLERKSSVRQAMDLNIQKANQFSDSKFQKIQQTRFRSHKSQYLSLPKTNLLTRGNSPSKISLKVSQDKRILNREKPNIHIIKKSHQLKIQ